MNERLQRALDGELHTDDLNPAELAELEEARNLFTGIVGAIPAGPLPDTGQAVLRRLHFLDEPADERGKKTPGLTEWLWSARSVSFQMRPAYALAAAALIAVAIWQLPKSGDVPGNTPPVVASPGIAEVLVHFRLDAPNATSVSLAGDFSDWQPVHTLTRTGSGVWTIVVPLTPGVHDYSFVVDGKTWVPDPSAPARDDGFGGLNSRIAVLAPDSRRSL